jgi:peptidyl-prolyl cis-trans isomerase C
MLMQLMKAAAAAALTLAGMLALSACNAQDSNAGTANIAVVNGVPIPQARLDYVVKTQVQQGQKDDETMRKQIKEALITREILAQEAVKKGLDKDPHLQTQVDMAKQEFLIRAYFDDFVKSNAVTEDEMKAEYERVKAQQTGDGERKEYRARHILMKDEKQAKVVLAQVNKAKGKNFAQLAKTKSEDPGSKAEGGLMDWSDGSNFVKEFSEAMVKLDKGQYTKQLVKTQYGYHIIMMDDVREMQFPPFEQVKERIEQQLLAQKRDKAIEALRTAAKVE